MAVRPIPAGIAYADDADRRAARSRTWRKLGRNPAAVLGVLILLGVVSGTGGTGSPARSGQAEPDPPVHAAGVGARR